MKNAYGDEDAHGQGPRVGMTRIEKRVLILWIAVAFVVWNGVYDMRMHDTVQHYLFETAQAPVGRGPDMRAALHRGVVDAIAFSAAWAFGVLLAGLATIRAMRTPSR